MSPLLPLPLLLLLPGGVLRGERQTCCYYKLEVGIPHGECFPALGFELQPVELCFPLSERMPLSSTVQVTNAGNLSIVKREQEKHL